MIRATMYWSRMRMEVDGHADYAEKGQDIVCAGASMLTQALGATLEEAEARGRCECKAKNDDGKALIWANPTLGSMAECKAYFRMAVKGFRLLQEQYPGYVSMKEVN